MHENSQQYTAFHCRYGCYMYKIMPFGIASAPTAFQRMMDDVLKPLLTTTNEIFVYIDDIILATTTFDRHLQLLEKTFQLLTSVNLKIRPSKCLLASDSAIVLGHRISNGTITPDERKIKAIVDLPPPTNSKEVQKVLGIFTYLRSYIPNFSTKVAPLTKLISKHTAFEWNNEQQLAFEHVKKVLTTAPTLQVFDPTKDIVIETDASLVGVAAVLLQPNNNDDSLLAPVVYYSRKLTPAQKNYPPVQLELLAVVQAAQQFHKYIDGRNVELRTDNTGVAGIIKSTTHTSNRLARWQIFLQQYDFTVKHRQGKTNWLADGMSRAPVEQAQPDMNEDIITPDTFPL